MSRPDCGCRVEAGAEYNTEHQGTDEISAIVYCDLHGAAPDLYSALSLMLAHSKDPRSCNIVWIRSLARRALAKTGIE